MTPTAEPDLPDTTPYRVVLGFAIYDAPQVNHNARGEAEVLYVRRFATRSQPVDLIDREADRLLALGAIVPIDTERTYDEMPDAELAELALARNIVVPSSGADPALPLRADYLTALATFDRGEAQQGVGVGTVPGGVAGGGARLADFGSAPLEGPQGVGDPKALRADTATVEEIADTITGEKLNASDTVALAGDDPGLAEKVLAAERSAQSGDARATVEGPLQKIIDGPQ